MASLVRFRYGLPGCLPPCTDQTGSPALGDFYFQAFNGSVALSVAGYNYNSGWISFCWRDLHPLEWQLASLHGQKLPPELNDLEFEALRQLAAHPITHHIPSRIQSRLKDIGYAKEVLGGIVLTKDGLQRISEGK